MKYILISLTVLFVLSNFAYSKNDKFNDKKGTGMVILDANDRQVGKLVDFSTSDGTFLVLIEIDNQEYLFNFDGRRLFGFFMEIGGVLLGYESNDCSGQPYALETANGIQVDTNLTILGINGALIGPLDLNPIISDGPPFSLITIDTNSPARLDINSRRSLTTFLGSLQDECITESRVQTTILPLQIVGDVPEFDEPFTLIVR